MWSHHQKRQRMKHDAAIRHHEMRQQATGTAVHGEDPQVVSGIQAPCYGDQFYEPPQANNPCIPQGLCAKMTACASSVRHGTSTDSKY